MRHFVVAVRDRHSIDHRVLEQAIASGDAVIVSQEESARPPSLLQKVANFTTSAVKHVAAGAPRCTQEQVDARFAICQTCPHYDGRACRLCGCPVVREQAYISKLSWANEKCPAGKWGPVQVES